MATSDSSMRRQTSLGPGGPPVFQVQWSNANHPDRGAGHVADVSPGGRPLRASARRPAPTRSRRLRAGHVQRRLPHGPGPRLRRGEHRLLTAPYESRAKLGKPVVDRVGRTVRVRGETAKDFGSQGCVNLPIHFKPVKVPKQVDPAKRWPMGDAASPDAVPAGLDAAKVKQAVDAAFDPAGLTAAFVVVWKGHIVGERYAANIQPRAPLESWSMGKSVTATLLATLIRRGIYKLDQPAPIPEWQKPGDPRAKIRIEDLLHMSSGLRCRAPNDPDFDPARALSRPPVPLHDARQRLRVRRDAPRPVGAKHGRPLPQHGPGPCQLPDPSGRGEARRGVPVLPAAGVVRQTRRRHDGARDGPAGQLSRARVRPRQPGTGRGSACSICRTASGTANASCRRASSSSFEHSPPRGRRRIGRSTAASSGSTGTAALRSRRNPTR